MESIFDMIMKMITPNAANAEVVPTDLYTQRLAAMTAQDPRYADVYNAAHALPDKVFLSTNPELAASAPEAPYGKFSPAFVPWLGQNQITFGTGPQNTMDNRKNTMAHELTHFLINQKAPSIYMTPMNESLATQVGNLGVPGVMSKQTAEREWLRQILGMTK
jgi:hypothetical protein